MQQIKMTIRFIFHYALLSKHYTFKHVYEQKIMNQFFLSIIYKLTQQNLYLIDCYSDTNMHDLYGKIQKKDSP